MRNSLKVFVLPCQDLGLWQEERDVVEQVIQERSFLLNQKQEKGEWESCFNAPEKQHYAKKQSRVKEMEKRVEQIMERENRINLSGGRRKSMQCIKPNVNFYENCLTSGAMADSKPNLSRSSNSTVFGCLKISQEPTLVSSNHKRRFSRYMNDLEPKKVAPSTSLYLRPTPSEKRMKTSSLQYPESSGMPEVQSEVNVELKHLKEVEMEAKAQWKARVVFKECLELCTPELKDELRKLDSTISEEALDKTMMRFMQFDSVRRSLTEVERITNIMDPGLLSGERVKHYRAIVNDYLGGHGLSDEHGPVKDRELSNGCKLFHEMDEEDQKTLDKFQENLKKKREAAKSAKQNKDQASERKEVLPQLPIKYSVHPETYNDKVNKAVAQVNASVKRATVYVPQKTGKERKSAFYNLSKRFDADLRRQHEKKKAEREKQTGLFIGNRTIVPVPKHRRYEASAMTLDERRENTEELMEKFRHEVANALTIDEGAGHRMSADAYCKFLIDNAYDYGVPPRYVEEPRVRRKIQEGSYPNWTVKEEELSAILRFAWKGKLKKLRKALKEEKFQQKINRVDAQKRTALHFAASWGCIKTLNILLRCPGIDVNKQDYHGKTPLYKAMEIGSIECVKALVKAGANTRIKAQDSRDPLTYLLHFYGDERFEMFKLLWDVSPRINVSYTPQ
eukprot:TCONS_00041044-protein